MNRLRLILLRAVCSAFLVTSWWTGSTLRSAELPLVSAAFGDNMVLQRDKPAVFWGWARPGEKVRVELSGRTAVAEAGADGKWITRVEPPAAGGPYEVTIVGSKTVTLKNVLVGDVWLCSGQSNMEFGLPRVKNGAEEVRRADHPQIRLFHTKQRPAYSAKSEPIGEWKVCSPTTVAEGGAGFSAVAYFFAEKLQSELNVPIGLIESAVGGSPAESWTAPEGLRDFPEFTPALNEIARLRAAGAPEYGNFITHWYDEYEVGSKGTSWADESLPTSDWKPVTIPGGFAELGVEEYPSVCWFRREITLPDPLPPGPAKIRLGVIEKMDTTFINGRWIGASSWVENPRSYPIPAGVLRPGKNLVAVRVFKLKKNGGFMSAAGDLRLELGDGSTVPLAGEWVGKLSVDARPPHPLPLAFENYPTLPTVLYFGMIAPFEPLSLRGALWYQGEANTTHAAQYRRLLPAMITTWREHFQQGNFPVYIVSLPKFMARRDQPSTDGWAELREAQVIAAQSVGNAAVIPTIDTGDPADIHPTDKRPIGERLARAALALTYGKDVPYSGPRYASVEREAGALKIKFSQIAGKLVVRGERLEEFSVAGADRKWHWAEAKLEGDTVIVSSPDVPEPVAARYAWQGSPQATLFDDSGLPAMPFRTDDW